MNSEGHHESLIPAQPGNGNALRHGAYSPRTLTPRAQEIAAGLMAAAHTVPLDQIAAEEIAALIAIVESVDADLAQRGLLNRSGQPRTLLDLRIRLSGRLERWLREFGATPASRVDWVGKLSNTDDLLSTLRRELARSAESHAAGDPRADGGGDDAAGS